MSIPNQAPDSRVPGILQTREPAGSLPYQIAPGLELENYLQQYIAALAHLDGVLVRPRWQEDVPNLPEWGVDWCAVGIIRRTPIGTYAAVVHHGRGDGYCEMQRHEELTLLVSFYGPEADAAATRLHSGLMIWQNTSQLRLVGLAFVEISEHRRVPEMIKNRWWNRVDQEVRLRRIIRSTYPVLSILAAPGVVRTAPGGYRVPFEAR